MDIVHTIGSQLGQFMARKAAEQNLRFVASHDPLTGLFNRSIFNERLQQALAQAARFERSLSLLFIDLDGFKLVNDTLGHNAGDALLAELATRLRATLREGDVIGRMGGDEFVVLIEEFAEVSQVAEVAKKLLETVTRPFVLQGREFQVTASLGISIYPDDGQDAADAAQERRYGDVPGEAAGQEQLPLLLASDERAPDRAALAGIEPAAGDRARRAAAALPAEGRRPRRPGDRGGGADAVAAPDAGHDQPQRVRAGGGGRGADRRRSGNGCCTRPAARCAPGASRACRCCASRSTCRHSSSRRTA